MVIENDFDIFVNIELRFVFDNYCSVVIVNFKFNGFFFCIYYLWYECWWSLKKKW